MSTIELPLTWTVRALGPAIIGLGSFLVLLTPVDGYAQLATIVAEVVFGGWQWRRWLDQRPLRVSIGQHAGFGLVLTNGASIAVDSVRPGVVRPWLLSARLVAADGRRADLFVPAGAVPADQHHALRQAVLNLHARALS